MKEINILLGMLEGKYAYDEYHLKSFEILGKSKVPKELNIFYEIQNFNKNIKFPLFKNVLLNRISIFKEWLREGKMNCYHLPLFTNIELFIYCIKMHFCQKYYGENDYSNFDTSSTLFYYDEVNKVSNVSLLESASNSKTTCMNLSGSYH